MPGESDGQSRTKSLHDRVLILKVTSRRTERGLTCSADSGELLGPAEPAVSGGVGAGTGRGEPVSTEDASVPYDPAQVTNLVELAACLRRLLDRRGMSYSALTKAAALLPRRNGQSQSLPKSTISDMLSGKRVPPKDKLLTLLAACRVPPDDIPAWLAAWDRARSGWIAAAQPLPPPRRTEWWRPFLIPVAIAVVVSAGTTAFAFWATGASATVTAPLGTKAALVVVQNKWAAGTTDLVEYTTPAFLSTRTESYCESRGCKISGTDMSSGALLPVTCHINGERMYNYNLDTATINKNPNQSASTLWYRGVFPNGRAGYISETVLTAASRGGLGLPECSNK